jgi:hypothetical protein
MNLSLPLPQEKPYSADRWQPKRMAWWYWAVIDEMVANPDVTKQEIANRFNISIACLNLVTTSDLFRYHYLERRKELAAKVDEAIRDRLGEVAKKSLGYLGEVLDKKRDQMPVRDLVEISKLSLEKLGYGVPANGGVTVNTTGNTQVVVPVSLKDLEAARTALRATESAKLIEGEQSE